MVLPHEYATDYQTLLDTKEPPAKELFYSQLKEATITDGQYQNFLKVWNKLNITSLLQLYQIYNICDTILYGDSVSFFFEKLFQLTHLYPSKYLTLSSLAVDSLLFNGRHPRYKNRRLFLPFMDSESYELVANSMLNGGFSASMALFANFNAGFIGSFANPPPGNAEDGEEGGREKRVHETVQDMWSEPPLITEANYLDYNSLYPGLSIFYLPVCPSVRLIQPGSQKNQKHSV